MLLLQTKQSEWEKKKKKKKKKFIWHFIGETFPLMFHRGINAGVIVAKAELATWLLQKALISSLS